MTHFLLCAVGNKAVQLVVNLIDKLESLEKNQAAWRANIAEAASVEEEQVVIVDVKLHYDREKEQKAAKAAAAKATAAAAKPAAAEEEAVVVRGALWEQEWRDFSIGEGA
jgi:hypothetical protein